MIFRICLSVFVIFFFCSVSPILANNLTISNATLEDRNASAGTVAVQFNISWDHSWRENDGRRDAVWVFCKVYKNTTAPWIHGKLKTAGTSPVDTNSGTNGDTEIIVPSDKIGAFIQRRASGKGSFSSSKVQLTLDLNTIGVSSTDTIQVKVFGIEMVYITTGPFYIGDGDGQNESQYAFHQNGVDNTPVQITTAAVTVAVDSNANDDIDTSPVSVDGDGGLSGNSSWPTGYNAFYMMKYEMTQLQYVDFLNTLTREQQQTRVASTVSGATISNYYVMTGGLSGSQRQSIRAPATGNGTSPTTVVFGMDLTANTTFNEAGDGANLAMNYANYMDFAAYADWAGLRPMTELEFEKAARGSNSAIYGEYAWGSTKITQAEGTELNSGFSTEVPATKGDGLANYNGSGTDITGPLRVGFAATSYTNRVSSGAGYYGAMELTGNSEEQVVTLGTSNGRSFTGTHGDGTLTTTASYEGNATNNDWPGIDATSARGVTGATGSGYRGGSWGDSSALEAIGYRGNASSGITTRTRWRSGRCVRTAP